MDVSELMLYCIPACVAAGAWVWAYLGETHAKPAPTRIVETFSRKEHPDRAGESNYVAAIPHVGLHPTRRSFARPESDALISAMAGSRTHVPLTDREADILRSLVVGRSNKAIASELAISEAVVKAHVRALLRKMQVANRTQAAIAALSLLGPETDGLRREPSDTSRVP